MNTTTPAPLDPHFGKTLDADGRPVLFSCETIVENVGGTPVASPTCGEQVPVETVTVGQWLWTGHAFWRVTEAARPWRRFVQVGTTERNVNRFRPGRFVFVVENDEAESLAVAW